MFATRGLTLSLLPLKLQTNCGASNRYYYAGFTLALVGEQKVHFEPQDHTTCNHSLITCVSVQIYLCLFHAIVMLHAPSCDNFRGLLHTHTLINFLR